MDRAHRQGLPGKHIAIHAGSWSTGRAMMGVAGKQVAGRWPKGRGRKMGVSGKEVAVSHWNEVPWNRR